MIFSWRFTVAPLCAVYHGGDGSKAGNSARTLPRRPLAKVAQEQESAAAARGSDEAEPLGRGELRRQRESKVHRRGSQPMRTERGGSRLGSP